MSGVVNLTSLAFQEELEKKRAELLGVSNGQMGPLHGGQWYTQKYAVLWFWFYLSLDSTLFYSTLFHSLLSITFHVLRESAYRDMIYTQASSTRPLQNMFFNCEVRQQIVPWKMLWRGKALEETPGWDTAEFGGGATDQRGEGVNPQMM